MKTRFFAFYTLSAFAALSIGVLSAVAGQRGGLLPMLASADESYTLVLNQNKNVLTDGTGSGTFVTEKGTALSVEYQQYMSSSESWGRLGPSGYIQNAHGEGGRIGGLISISYEITRALTIEYGFDAYPGKEFCRTATLSRAENTFSFGDEKPDRFRISSSGDWSSIISMTFTYSCSPTDSHTHEYTTDKLGRVGSTGNYEYKHICDICGEANGSAVNFSNYKVTLDGITYDPYTFDTYSGIGSLDFDYNETIEPGNKRFILTINGDHTGTDLTINSNQTDASSSQIYIKAENNAKVHDIKFYGGYGVLLFIGDKLTFVNGNLTTEATVTSVKGKLSFEDTRKSKDAITVSNGSVYLENDVYITGYNVGVRLSRNLTGQDLHQTGGTFTIKNTDRALVSKTGLASGEYDGVFYLGSTALFEDCTYALSFGASFDITGNVTIKNCEYGTDGGNVVVKNYLFVDGCYHGLHHTNIQVGDDNNSGKLHIYVDNDDAKSDSDRACGIYAHNTNTINFYKGKAAIFSGSQNTRTSAIKVGNDEGWNNDMFSVTENFVYGFGNIKYGFDCENNSTAAWTESFSNSSKSTFKYYGVGDIAWYCGNKPTGTLLTSIDEFKTTFDIQ